MEVYNHQLTEKKWQKIWRDQKTYQIKNNGDLSASQKFYCLDMFPYPSGEGLHVGHPRGYTASDVYARYMRLKGKAVLYPMGWDAFGLPAENYAIAQKIRPQLAVNKNINRFKKQIQSLGFSYDWSREINTTDPEYYQWTQWIFLKMFRRGLAYEDEAPINWCPSCQTGLANEEVSAGRCERCQTPVVLKKIRQWHLKITQYADRLLNDLKNLDWPEPIKKMQENWIGKSRGAVIQFAIHNSQLSIPVFTTRPDTLFGVTYLVLAPEKWQELSSKLKVKNSKLRLKIQNYLTEAEGSCLSGDYGREKTGIFTGFYAINPINDAKIPLWLADYVSADYGTGAIMAVPGHDQRDWEFARKFNLPLIEVISGGNISKQAFIGKGKMVNSGRYSEMDSSAGARQIVKDLAKKGLAEKTVNYKLRDWVFSRQRYWGEPIPLVHCENCGVVPVAEEDLPVELPEVENYQPTGTVESPLAKIEEWVNTECPKCGGKARRETNTMPQWAGSCWYYLAYLIKKNSKFEIRNSKLFKNWLPVDLYVGGAEHAVLHLLYARFWHKVLYDEGVVSSKEPFQKLVSVGTILAPDGQKMSKSRGNVISPDELIEKYGADSLRLYELFLGPFSQAVAWNKRGIIGLRRFLDKVFKLQILVKPDPNSQLDNNLNKIIQATAQAIEKFSFNTAIAKLMSFVNLVYEQKKIGKEQFKKFLLILSPFAPHICAELWARGNKDRIEDNSYPAAEPIAEGGKIILPIQINGRLRGQIEVDSKSSPAEIIELAKKNEQIIPWLKDKKIVREIYVPLKIINFVVR